MDVGFTYKSSDGKVVVGHFSNCWVIPKRGIRNTKNSSGSFSQFHFNFPSLEITTLKSENLSLMKSPFPPEDLRGLYFCSSLVVEELGLDPVKKWTPETGTRHPFVEYSSEPVRRKPGSDPWRPWRRCSTNLTQRNVTTSQRTSDENKSVMTPHISNLVTRVIPSSRLCGRDSFNSVG